MRMAHDYQVIFSEVRGVQGYGGGMHWRAEMFDHGGGMGPGWMSHPIAVTYIGGVHSKCSDPSVDFLTVFDQWRGSPEAVRFLLKTCQVKFPGLWLTERIDATGELRGLAPDMVKRTAKEVR